MLRNPNFNIRISFHLKFFNDGFEAVTDYKKYRCLVCGWEYDEAQGSLEAGLKPGTRWEDIPLTWRCPDCDAMKEDFEMIEV